MHILVLNGSPRPNGSTAAMVEAFAQGARASGHQVEVVLVCQKKIAGCLACEYCHTRGNGRCIQQDDMQQVYRHSCRCQYPARMRNSRPQPPLPCRQSHPAAQHVKQDCPLRLLAYCSRKACLPAQGHFRRFPGLRPAAAARGCVLADMHARLESLQPAPLETRFPPHALLAARPDH